MVDGMGIMYGTPASKFHFKHHSEGIEGRGGTAHSAPNIPTPGTKQIYVRNQLLPGPATHPAYQLIRKKH